MADSMKFSITHLSTACTLLEIGSLRILTDPVFDRGKQRYRFGPGIAATRWQNAVLPTGGLPPIDAVLLSHSHHMDNLDKTGKKFVLDSRDAQGRPSRVISHPSAKEFFWYGFTPLKAGERTELRGTQGEKITITATPASHGPPALLGLVKDVGDVIGFLLEWDGQEHGAVYISGDTVCYYELTALAEEHQIGTAILHLGGVHFKPPLPVRVLFTMPPGQAAQLALKLNPHTIIPIHYETSVWSHFKHEVPEYIEAFNNVGLRKRVHWLTKGVATPIET
jgi:L-ascorbate metabolism protein UlaG (beta-lactamase superfamily)